jgi:hypothetical protein
VDIACNGEACSKEYDPYEESQLDFLDPRQREVEPISTKYPCKIKPDHQHEENGQHILL